MTPLQLVNVYFFLSINRTFMPKLWKRGAELRRNLILGQ